MKLASELHKRSTGKSIYILDEPTTGLHVDDISRLLKVLNRLVENGDTVVIIEHNLDVIKTADYIIDLGPEGGSGGGTIVATGTPEDIAQTKSSYTGKYLKKYLNEINNIPKINICLRSEGCDYVIFHFFLYDLKQMHKNKMNKTNCVNISFK